MRPMAFIIVSPAFPSNGRRACGASRRSFDCLTACRPDGGALWGLGASIPLPEPEPATACRNAPTACGGTAETVHWLLSLRIAPGRDALVFRWPVRFPFMTTTTSAHPPQSRPPIAPTSKAQPAVAAAGVLAMALLLAGWIQVLQAPYRQQNEKAVFITAVLFAAILAAVPGIYILRRRRDAQPETAGLAFLGTLTVLLLAIYFFWVRWYVFFPADIWTWSEGDYVNDMLKFSVGYLSQGGLLSSSRTAYSLATAYAPASKSSY